MAVNVSKPIPARKIVKKPDLLDSINQYIFLIDSSGNNSYVNMLKAINILSGRGWEAVSTSTDNYTMITLMRRPAPRT